MPYLLTTHPRLPSLQAIAHIPPLLPDLVMRNQNAHAARVFQSIADTETAASIARPTGPLADPASQPTPIKAEPPALDPIDPLPAKLERERACNRQRVRRAVDRARSRAALSPSVPRSLSASRSRNRPRPLDGQGYEYDEAAFWADVWADATGQDPKDLNGALVQCTQDGVEDVVQKEVTLTDLIRPSRASKGKLSSHKSKGETVYCLLAPIYLNILARERF